MGSLTREAAQREEQLRQSANDRQVGGAHYRKGRLQHWDVVERYSVPYLEGVGSKYPLRWREKGGVEDLEKTLHYIDKILERPEDHDAWHRMLRLTTQQVEDVRKLVASHDCGIVEREVVTALLCGVNRLTLETLRRDLDQYVREVRTEARQGTPEDGGQHAAQEDTEVSVTVTERHLHLHLPEGCSGTLRIVGEVSDLTWGGPRG